MTTGRYSLFATISAIMIHGGCSIEGGILGDTTDPDATLLQPTGFTFASRSANGEELGRGRPGTEILGTDAQGTTLDGRMLTHLSLVGSSMASIDVENGHLIAGADLVGATFQTVTPAMDRIEVHIAAVEARPATTPEQTVHRYTISYRRADDPVAAYACGVNRVGVPIKAIPMEHLWDYRQGVPGAGSRLLAPGWITFACEGFALAKCVHLGYLAWTLPESDPLAAYHQACTRMIRADYCGDGRTFSQENLEVDVYDALGIQTPSPRLSSSPWRTEAEWTEKGARCVRRSRSAVMPPGGCSFEIEPKLCGNPPHWEQTLLVSEMP